MRNWWSRQGGPLIDASAPRPTRVRRTPRDERLLVVLLAGVAAVLAILGGASPTGIAFVDAAYVGGAGAALALAGGRSRRMTWLASSLLALWLTPSTPGRIAAIAAVLIAVYAVRTRRRRSHGALVGTLVAFVLADLGAGPFHGATTLFAAAAAAPMLVSGALLMPTRWRRPFVATITIWCATSGLATAVFVVASAFAVGDVTDGIRASHDGFDLAGEGDQDGAARAFDSSVAGFDAARGKVSGFWTLPARLVPVVGQHVRAVQVVAGEGVALSATAADAARTVDVDEVRFVDGALDLGILDDLRPVLDRTERALERADERISAARSPWLVTPLDSRVEELLEELADARPSASTAAAAVEELPVFLGADRPVNWLVLVATPAEARGLGGLVGNWVLVEADEGKLTIASSGRNEELNASLRAMDVELRASAQYLARWARFSPNEFFQDVTVSPDLPMVAEVAADLFTQATGEPVDGVVTVDPYAIAALLQLGGPVETTDRTLTARTVVPYLLQDQYPAYADDEPGRVLALAELMEGAFGSVTTGELPGPRAVADVLGPVIEQDRLGVWWAHDEQETIDAAELDGRFPRVTDGDLLALVHQNAGQNKLDTYLRRELDYRLDIADGAAEATITVVLHNDLDDLTLPPAVIASNDQGYPLGTNVVRLSVHTALGFRAARLDGADIAVERQLAFGHDAITTLIEVPAGASRVLEIDVAGELGESPYQLMLPYQPLVNDDAVTLSVTVDGQTLEIPPALTLTRDMVVSPSEG